MRQSTSSCGTNVARLLLALTLIITWAPPPCTQAFDLSSIMAALRGSMGSTAGNHTCPSQCQCSVQRAETVMHGYVTRYLPLMGEHLNPDLEKKARGTITLLTAWLGTMANFKCALSPGERANMSELLESTPLSFKSLQVTCLPGSTLVWDLTALEPFVNIIDINGCHLEKGEQGMALPMNLWLLHLNEISENHVQQLELGFAAQLLSLSITNSSLTKLPVSWLNMSVPRIMFLNLADNDLQDFRCEIKTTHLTSVNLDRNQFTTIPSCILNGVLYTSHLSLRQNQICCLYNLMTIDSEEENKQATNKNPKLFYLDLAHNELTNLPILKTIDPLLALDLSHNSIVSLAKDVFSRNPHLDWLDISQNMLEQIQEGAFSKLSFITHLNLSHNQLRMFKFDHSPVSTHRLDIDLTYNRLLYPPFADTGYITPRKSSIHAGYNPYICDCGMRIFVNFLKSLNESARKSWFKLGYWDGFKKDFSAGIPFVDTDMFRCWLPTLMKGSLVSDLSFTHACPLLRGCPSYCQCNLVKQNEGMEAVVVNCSNQLSLTELPDHIPVIPNKRIVLDISSSGVKRIEHRPYLRYLDELHAGCSKLSFITSGAIQAMENISTLDLHNNYLRSLPSITANMTLTKLENMSLGHNPWACGCQDLWMPEWLDKYSLALYEPDSIKCRWSAKKVSQLKEADLNCGILNFLPLIIALSMFLALAVVGFSLLAKYKLEVLVFLYTHFKIRPFDQYTYDQQNPYLYDVFISFSQHDYRWVIEKLVDQLENRPRPYKLCIHLRDFPVGASIADSISWAVENSRCTVLVLTRDFLSSEWCRHEFRLAHARLLTHPQAKLLVLVHGALDARILDRELLAYLRTHSYLRTEDAWFWSKLEYALPSPSQGANLMPVALPEDEDEGNDEPIDMDTFVPRALAAGDLSPKPEDFAHVTMAM